LTLIKRSLTPQDDEDDDEDDEDEQKRGQEFYTGGEKRFATAS